MRPPRNNKEKETVYRVPICLALVALLVSGFAARPAAADEESVTVPLTKRGSHIFVEGTIDGQSLLFALDTGAGADVLTPAAVKRLGLKPERGQAGVVGAGGSASLSSMVRMGNLHIWKATLTDPTAFVIPLPDALECDGLLGAPFFKAWVVQIDYANRKLTLIPRSAFRPPTDATAVPIRFNKEIPELEATVDGIKGYFKMDTGAGNAVTLFSPFIAENHLRGKYKPALETITGRGVGGLIYGELARVPTFSIGPFAFKGVTADLSQQKTGVFASADDAGNLGGEIWERFLVTLDYGGNKLYLARNSHFDEPFVGNRCGMTLDNDAGAFVVRAVIPNGPADKAGVHDGDIVLGIDGMPASALRAWEVRSTFRQDPGTSVRLRLRDQNKRVKDVTVTLRDLF